jgi:hypothetical protein
VQGTAEPGSSEKRRAWISSRGQTMTPILASVIAGTLRVTNVAKRGRLPYSGDKR